MKISFVIPAYNEEKLLPKCLESVLAELKRTPCEAEIVVVNNASTDHTKEVALRYPGVRVVDEPKKGLVQARHAGFNASTGELVANIDADTQLTPGWVATALREFAKDPRLVALSGPYLYHDLPAFTGFWVKIFYFFGWLGHLFNQYVLRAGAMLQGGNFVLRRDAWERAGGFDTSIEFYGEDTDVAHRINRQGKVKWTWRFPMYTSGRRLAREGVVRTGLVYTINFLSVSLFGKPATREYTDIRTG
jgi:glycosyltransferase involved in cell wall biosynthesis